MLRAPQYEASGYDPALLTGPIKPPATVNESLARKPFAQQFYQKMIVGTLGPNQTLDQQTKYINFYANLIKKSDEFLVRASQGRQAERPGAARQPFSLAEQRGT